jgi:TRAP-type mannitol/chloroaromatic compound transport system permease small subunit
MSEPKKSFFDWIDIIVERAANITCYLIFIIMLITALDVIARYAFNRPLLWGWLVNRQLFGVFILFAGVYTLFKGGHIRIEILYDNFPSKLKKIARWIALLSFICFMSALIWQSAWMGWNSFTMNEKAAGAFRIPWYPFKLLIPVVTFLFLLEGIAAFRRDND